jgi:hypothetical protein
VWRRLSCGIPTAFSLEIDMALPSFFSHGSYSHWHIITLFKRSQNYRKIPGLIDFDLFSVQFLKTKIAIPIGWASGNFMMMDPRPGRRVKRSFSYHWVFDIAALHRVAR